MWAKTPKLWHGPLKLLRVKFYWSISDVSGWILTNLFKESCCIPFPLLTCFIFLLYNTWNIFESYIETRTEYTYLLLLTCFVTSYQLVFQVFWGLNFIKHKQCLSKGRSRILNVNHWELFIIITSIYLGIKWWLCSGYCVDQCTILCSWKLQKTD